MVFIPWVAVGAGAAIIAWGTKMIIDDDDSADKAAAEFFRKLPSHIRQHVQRVEYTGSGFNIYWKSHVSLSDRRRLESEL